MSVRIEKTVDEVTALIAKGSQLINFKVTGDLLIRRNVQSQLTFINCEFDEINIWSQPHDLTHITFDDCKVIGTAKFTAGAVLSTLRILNSNFNRLDVSSCRVDNLFIEKQSEIKEIVSAHLQGNILEFKDSRIEQFHIKYIKLISFSIDNTPLQKKSLLNGEFESVDIFNTDDIILEASFVITSSLNITRAKNSSITLFKVEVKKTAVFANCQQTDLTFSHTKCQNIELSRNNLKSITFEDDGSYDLECLGQERQSIEKAFFSYFTLSKSSNLVFSDIRIEKLFLDEISNLGYIEFHNCIIEKHLTAFNANLGKVTFSRVKFPNSKNIRLNYSYLMSAEFTNVDWSYEISEHFNEKLFESKEQFLISIRETYRQLKNVYESQGSKIESLEFKRRELDSHYKLLRARKTVGMPTNWMNLGNYLIVWTNRYGSGYGQNIWRPLIFLFIFHLIFFTGFLQYNYKLNLTPLVNINSEASWAGVSLYWQTIIPTHSSELFSYSFNSKESIGGFWDLLLRISSGYFIYYFITASRKYHQ